MYKAAYIAFIFIGFLYLALPIVYADGVFFPSIDYKKDIYEPTQKAIIIYNGTNEHIIIEATYNGDIDDFAWIVPVPTYPNLNQSYSTLFDELSVLTIPEYRYGPDLFPLFNGPGAARSQDILLEHRQVGIYSTDILSSKDSQGIINWLSTNNYTISNAAEPIINEYVNKGWYFIAIKINPNQQLITSVKKMNSSITNIDEAVEYLTDMIVKDANSAVNYLDVNLSLMGGAYLSYITNSDITYNSYYDFYEYRGVLGNNHYLEQKKKELLEKDKNLTPEDQEYLTMLKEGHGDEARFRNSVRTGIQTALLKQEAEIQSALSNGVVQPIAINFKTEQIIYPLKISSINPGQSEILLYIIANYRTKVQNMNEFDLEYAKWITPEMIKLSSRRIYNIESKHLGEIVRNKVFLTKLRANVTSTEMINDLVIIQDVNDKEYIPVVWDFTPTIFSSILLVIVIGPILLILFFVLKAIINNNKNK